MSLRRSSWKWSWQDIFHPIMGCVALNCCAISRVKQRLRLWASPGELDSSGRHNKCPWFFLKRYNPPPQKKKMQLTGEHQRCHLCDDKYRALVQEHKHTGCLKSMFLPPGGCNSTHDNVTIWARGQTMPACYLITWSGHRNKGAPTLWSPRHPHNTHWLKSGEDFRAICWRGDRHVRALGCI